MGLNKTGPVVTYIPAFGGSRLHEILYKTGLFNSAKVLNLKKGEY